MKKTKNEKKVKYEHGGARPGAGRPSRFGEPTVRLMLPARLKNDFSLWLSKNMVKK